MPVSFFLFSFFLFSSRKTPEASRTDYDNTAKWIYLYVKKNRTDIKQKHTSERGTSEKREITVPRREEKRLRWLALSLGPFVKKKKNQEMINKLEKTWLIYWRCNWKPSESNDSIHLCSYFLRLNRQEKQNSTRTTSREFNEEEKKQILPPDCFVWGFGMVIAFFTFCSAFVSSIHHAQSTSSVFVQRYRPIESPRSIDVLPIDVGFIMIRVRERERERGKKENLTSQKL